MNRNWIAALALIVAFSGCRTVQHSLVAPSQPTTSKLVASKAENGHKTASKKKASRVRQVAFQEDDSSQEDDAPQSGLISAESSTAPQAEPIVNAVPFESSVATSLPQLEQAALATNPAVAEIQAEIESLRGKLTQAGLPPNPTAGIVGSDINEDGVSAGRYGVYFGREVVRGNKLGYSRSVVCAEIETAEQRLAIVQQRLLTDVRQRYYDLLVAQETVSMAEELVKISQNAVDVSKRLLEAKEAAQTSVLQSEIELQNASVVKRQAENQRLAARRKLAGLLGEADLSLDYVDGNVRELIALTDFEQSFDDVVNSSPEIAALFADVEQKRRQLQREIVEPIPNVTWQTSLQYDFLTDDVIPGFQIGMPIPTLNRNQGAIHQARYQIVAAERRAEKKALDLRQRLANAYESYLDAKLQVDAYDSEIIPKAKRTLDLVTKGYKEGEIDFLQLLTAQRTYSQINLTYLQQLRQVWQQNVEIKGMLLTGSLQ